MMGMSANGPVMTVLNELRDSGETVLPVLREAFTFTKATGLKRYLIDRFVSNI